MSELNEVIEMEHYSAALDEIFRLRTALAYEARVLDAHLGYQTFPKSRRPAAELQVLRMLNAARGISQAAYAAIENRTLWSARKDAGMSLLTRWQWENERPGVKR